MSVRCAGAQGGRLFGESCHESCNLLSDFDFLVLCVEEKHNKQFGARTRIVNNDLG